LEIFVAKKINIANSLAEEAQKPPNLATITLAPDPYRLAKFRTKDI
jgi:hypothetical protein